MLFSWSFEFAVGVTSGAVLIAALVQAAVFRNLALVITTAAIVYVLVNHGVPGLVQYADGIRAQVMNNLDFSKGLLVGTIGAAKLMFLLRSWNFR